MLVISLNPHCHCCILTDTVVTLDLVTIAIINYSDYKY